MQPSAYEIQLEQQIEKLKEKLDALQLEQPRIEKLKEQLDARSEKSELGWAERTSDFLHKGKSLAVETIALLSLLAAGGHIVANEFSDFGHEKPNDKKVQLEKKKPTPKSSPDFELIRQTLLKNEAVTRQTIGDAEFERLKAILYSLHTTEHERTHQRNLPCPCGSGKKFRHCHGKGRY